MRLRSGIMLLTLLSILLVALHPSQIRRRQ